MSIFRLSVVTSFFFAANLCATSAHANTKVIHAGELLAIPGEKPQQKQTIVIENGKVLSVSAGFLPIARFGEDAQLIDLSTRFVMPGLMDMHVHLQGELGPDNKKELVEMSDADVAMRSVHFANKTLMAGFTTVRDVGSQSEQMYAIT